MFRHYRPRRWDAAKRPIRLLTILAIMLAATVAAPAAAQTAPGPTSAAPTVAPVDWLPLRHNLDGSAIKLGCTYNSRGSQYGYQCGGHHSRWALDLIAQTGTPVYAVRAGFATNATGQQGGSGYGNLVRVEHGAGVETYYAHLSKVEVPAQGAWVDQNTVIGLVGSTGSSSTPHLHYEKRVAGQSAPIDPGSLAACGFGELVNYPQIAGHDSWYGLAWGSFTLVSEGTECGEPTVTFSGETLSNGLPSPFLLLALARLTADPTTTN